MGAFGASQLGAGSSLEDRPNDQENENPHKQAEEAGEEGPAACVPRWIDVPAHGRHYAKNKPRHHVEHRPYCGHLLTGEFADR
jgi:hypothetical protein